MITVPFQQTFTWRKLGYLYYTNSLDYRAVLEQNPQWTVTELPPLGATLTLPNAQNTSGGLVQSSFVYGLPQNTAAEDIFPFDTEDSYAVALNRYTVTGVQDRVAINGLTFDSDQAVFGVQQG
jgi:hypothetical protein